MIVNNPNKSASSILKDMNAKGKTTISWISKQRPDSRVAVFIQIKDVCHFDGNAPTEEQARVIVANKTIGMIRNIAQLIENFKSSKFLM